MSDLGTNKVAEMLGVTRAYVSKMCRDGKFKHATQDGKCHPWHIPMEDVEEYKARKNKK